MASWAYTISFLGVATVGFLALWLNAADPGRVSGWRYLIAFGAIGAVVVLFLRRNLPASPRWLATHGREREATAALAAFAAGSGITPNPIKPEPTDGPRAGTGIRVLGRKPFARRLAMMYGFHLLQTFGYYDFRAIVLASRGYTVTASLVFIALSYPGYSIGSLLSTPLMRVLEQKLLIILSLIAIVVTGLLFATATGSAMIIVFGFLTTSISNVFSNAYHVY